MLITYTKAFFYDLNLFRLHYLIKLPQVLFVQTVWLFQQWTVRCGLTFCEGKVVCDIYLSVNSIVSERDLITSLCVFDNL